MIWQLRPGVWILDDAFVQVGATSADEDISGFCAQAMVSIQNTEVPTPHTFGAGRAGNHRLVPLHRHRHA